ncbi:MAG: hypothetical protein ACYTFV_12070 [Planctomycetota bacterium]|jgi:hypothetical protein
MRAVTSTFLACLACGCSALEAPDRFGSLTLHGGSAAERGQFGVGGHVFRDRDPGFFFSLGGSGDFKDYPEYAPGTAASFGDPVQDTQVSAIGVGFGPTWGWDFEEPWTEGKPRHAGVFAGPYLGTIDEQLVYDDPTGILEEGQGGYVEGTGDSDFEIGAIFGAQLLFESIAIGVQYDSFHEGVAFSIGVTFGR